MIAERRPLGSLDPNVTRVQPTRAAKTGHKWLSHRKSTEDNNTNSNALCPQFQCPYIPTYPSIQPSNAGKSTMKQSGNQYLENHNSYQARLPAHDVLFRPTSHSLAKENCDNYQHVSVLVKSSRVPLQTLPNNVTGPILPHAVDNREHNPKYFAPIQKINDYQTSVIPETESESSFRSMTEDEFSDSFLSRSFSSSKGRKSHNFDTDSYLQSVKEKHPDLEILDEYMSDILTYMRTSELKYKPKETYLKKQSEITASMRVKLVDWLVEVQDEYKLQNETLYLAVSYVDRFLSEMSVTRAKLQLLGTTSMFIASKFEEIYPPDADEFAYVTADTYARDEVLLMERMILKVFNCRLAVPTAYQYLTIFHEKSNLDENCRYLSLYLSELSLLDDKYLAYTPSVTAASAISLALCTVRHAHDCDVANGNYSLPNNGSHNMSLEMQGTENNLNMPRVVMASSVRKFMTCQLDQIYQCVLDLSKSHVYENNSSHFIREKYMSSAHRSVAKIAPVISDATMTHENPLTWANVMQLWAT